MVANNFNSSSSLNSIGSKSDSVETSVKNNVSTKATQPVPLAFVPHIIYTGALNFPYTYSYNNT
jgi:hypothetical protein